MAFLHRLTNNRGQSLIELLIVMALMAMLLPVLLGGLIASREGRPQQINRSQAAQKLRETQEALRSI
ncbi:type II secretion system protein, partial [Candidatus Woesebacteria bacterium]|nr:type II secretion system protein [Candidatus Woesebacteria bacterium]